MFPSTISTFPIVNATDRLNNPSHSALHNTVSSAVGQIEAVIGVAGANSVLGTIITDLRSPGSNGGGHVQTANKGGTGQTTFQKGDLLMATSSSVLAKLAISSISGQVLVTDTNQATGAKWSPVVANKVATTTPSVTGSAGQLGGSVLTLYATSILGSTLGTNNAIRFTGALQKLSIGANVNITFTANYGNNVSASVVTTTNQTSVLGAKGRVSGVIVGGGTTSLQFGEIEFDAGVPAIGFDQANFTQYGKGYGMGNSSVASDATQNLVITAQYGSSNNANSILGGLFVVEKIV